MIFKVSLPGIDVKNASPEECVVHSDYPSPKINKHAKPTHRGLIRINLNNTYPVGDTVLFAPLHGYDYTPMVWAVIAEAGSANINVFGFQPYVSGLFQLTVKTDKKKMYVIATAFGAPQAPAVTLLVSFAIFVENGSDS